MSETEAPSTKPPAPPVLATPAVKPGAAKPGGAKPGNAPALAALLLCLVLCLLLAGGEAYLWMQAQTTPAATTAQLTALQTEITALQQQAARSLPPPDSLVVQADLANKVSMLSAQLQAAQTQLAADHAAITSMAANNADLTALANRITRLNRLESARIALESGQALGVIAGAPTALAQFATQAPPTMAALVLGFPAAAQAANAASTLRATHGAFWAGALSRLEGLVTISNGTHVVAGPPAAAITATAQAELDAGDLNGALTTLNGLSAETRNALNPWLAQAQALQAARAAIINMADAP